MTKNHQTFKPEQGDSTPSIKEVASLQEAMEESKNDNVKIIYVSRPMLTKEELQKLIPSRETVVEYLPVVLSGAVLIYLMIFLFKALSGNIEDSEGLERMLSAIHWFLFYPFALATTTFTTMLSKREGWKSAVIWTAFGLAWFVLIIIQLRILPLVEEILSGAYEFLRYLS